MKQINRADQNKIFHLAGIAAKPDAFDLIAIGCSAGGIEALRTILPTVKESFPIPVVVIQHRSADSPQILQDYFSLICSAKVEEPEDKESICSGIIYFAPTNYHLLIDENKNFNLSIDQLVNYSRPSIDVFFEAAADVYRERMLGIILSGANQDGARGLKAIVDRGGSVMVQNPESAEYKEMPKAAAVYVEKESLVTIPQIKNFFSELGSSKCKK